MKIGILGGTFNPIHNGHLIVAEYTRTSLDLDKIIFIPSGNHPFKDNRDILEAEERMTMVLLAIESNKFFQLSSAEVDRVGISYTVDTILDLRNKYKDDELYFIIGWDIIFDLEKWKDFNKLTEICKFALVGRPGNYKEKVEDKILELKSSYEIQIIEINVPLIEISSTEVRDRVGNELSIKYLVPEPVEDYILRYNLYAKGRTDE